MKQILYLFIFSFVFVSCKKDIETNKDGTKTPEPRCI